MTDTNQPQSLSEQLAKLPHYHVVSLSAQQYVAYSDKLTEPGAMAYAADLISPTSGEREPGLEVVWIAPVDPRACRLDDRDSDEDGDEVVEFLERLMQDEPYWTAPW